MEAIEIKVNYNKASLISNASDIISGSRGIVSIEFEFSAEWIGFTKTAILYINKYDENTAVKIILDEKNSIDAKYLSALIAKKCDLYIGVFGDKGEQRITTNVVCVQIREGVPTEGADAEVDTNLYNQILQIMDSTKEIAQSVRDDADSGIFKGDKGDNYNLTKEDKEEISESAKERVIEEIQLDLDNKVPKTRTVVGKKLESDISILDIVNAIYDNTGKNPISDFENLLTISKVIKDVKAVVDEKASKQYVDAKNENKAKRYTLEGSNEPTTNANEYLGVELGDICVNESYRAWICQYHYENIVVWSELLTPASSYLANNFYFKGQIDNILKEKTAKADWELIRNIEITEELGAIEITKDDADNAFEYDDIMVIANSVKGSNSGNWFVSIKTTANPTNSGLIQVGNANPLSSTTAKLIHTKIKRMFGVNRYEYESNYKNAGAYVSTINKGTVSTAFELNETTKINYIRIHFSTNNTINAGTILVYGRKRR